VLKVGGLLPAHHPHAPAPHAHCVPSTANVLVNLAQLPQSMLLVSRELQISHVPGASAQTAVRSQYACLRLGLNIEFSFLLRCMSNC
jgi:hypothetical protein